ncbi:MAG: class I SAM-dependent methyltransferase [Dehalococcoidales bacterium]|nr:class I SAM-dependent methyltransferase [Dehalococcoidales bacterium]
MPPKDSKAENWNEIARAWKTRGYSNELLAENKKKVYRGLLDKWTGITDRHIIFKTDLFTEAFEEEQFLFDIPGAGNIIGIDISAEIVRQAREQAELRGLDGSRYCCGDIRNIPFCDSSIDLVISDSTLDHFSSEKDIIVSLKEIGRILKTGGLLVLTLDNKHQITYLPYFAVNLWMKLGMCPYFVGKTLSLSRLRKALEESGLYIEDCTAILHYPHPDKLVRWLEHILRKLSGKRLDNAIRKGLDKLETLGGKRTKYLTGRYIAVKAVKRGSQAPEIASEAGAKRAFP